MGKAALDLPDPLQAPPEGARTSTDDLLAQLAGDEIDRLLAEADAAQPTASRAPFHVGPPPAPAQEPQPEVAAAAAPALVAPVESSQPTSVEMDVAAEMDALFSAATAKDEADEAAARAAVVARAAAEAEAETSVAERDGLKQPAAVAAPAIAPQVRVASGSSDQDVPLPLYLRPLEWLNAPLWLLPESARDIVGKIAIVTLINAAVILAYVLIVRRG